MQVLDITSKSTKRLEKSLSNFTGRPFELDGVFCGSMEGFLQALKFEDTRLAAQVARLVGYHAFKFGNQHGNGWKKEQVLWWKGQPYERRSIGYLNLLARAYRAQYEQSEPLRKDLRETVGFALRHSNGKSDPTDTVLTEAEYMKMLNMLRESLLDGLHDATLGDPSPDGQEQREADPNPSPS